jgi:hypothetical protein
MTITGRRLHKVFLIDVLNTTITPAVGCEDDKALKRPLPTRQSYTNIHPAQAMRRE